MAHVNGQFVQRVYKGEAESNVEKGGLTISTQM
jgi:hypothetical protein